MAEYNGVLSPGGGVNVGVLQNCPNCGSTLVMQNRKKGKFQYECDGDCWTRTGWYWNETEAAFAWNQLKKRNAEEES